jgi:hypothetical protein
MSERDSDPHCAYDRGSPAARSGDEQRVLLALDQDVSLQPKAVRVMIGVSSRSIGPIARPSTPDPGRLRR